MVGKQPSIFNLTKFNGVVFPYRKKVVKKNKGKIEKVILTLLNSKLKALVQKLLFLFIEYEKSAYKLIF